jgi:putative restriction endonuclease
MSRVETHGGGTWAFPNCVWAPTEKKNGGRWPFWSKVLEIQEGDTILHLRGIPPKAFFVGYSNAAANGFETRKRPPELGEWSFAKSFYRADLIDFTPFHKEINLTDVFETRKLFLEKYFDSNKEHKLEKRNIFFVRQSGRLQCLNGAYLTDVDAQLFESLFGIDPKFQNPKSQTIASVETGWQLSSIKSRLGQSIFSKCIKALYGNKCCFPNCDTADERFLVASHIARWSDNEKLRGHFGNGLCLCLTHDKAFELGLFTLDEKYRIFVNPKEITSSSEISRQLIGASGKSIYLPKIPPLDDALIEHWIRTDLSP